MFHFLKSNKFHQEILSFIFSSLKKIVLISIIFFGLFLGLDIIKSSLQSWFDTSLIYKSVSSAYRSFGIAYLVTTLTMSGSPIAWVIASINSSIDIPLKSLVALLAGTRWWPDLILFIMWFVALYKKKWLNKSLWLWLIEFFITLTISIGSLLIVIFIINTNNFWNFFENLAHKISFNFEKKGFLDYLITPLSKIIINNTSTTWSFIIGLIILILAIINFDKVFTFLDFKHKNDNSIKIDTRTDLFKLAHGHFEEIPKLAFKYFNYGYDRIKYWGWKIKEKIKPTFSQKFVTKILTFLNSPLNGFIIGFIITAFTMSLSVSVTILLPLFVNNLITRRTLFAYIMAANISTLFDTLILAIISNSYSSIAVILAFMFGVIIVVLFFSIFFKYYINIIEKTVDYITSTRKNFVLTFILIIIIPIILLFF